MKSNEVGTTLKHPETINGNVKNLSKRMEMKDKGECHFYLNETIQKIKMGEFFPSTREFLPSFSKNSRVFLKNSPKNRQKLARVFPQ
jgi:hypothetical protein